MLRRRHSLQAEGGIGGSASLLELYHAVIHFLTALRLARLFGTTPDFWMNMQCHHDFQVAAKELPKELAGIEVLEARPRGWYALSPKARKKILDGVTLFG